MEQNEKSAGSIVKKVLLIIAFVVLTIFNVIFLILAFAVLGNKQNVITQLGTVFFPLASAIIILFLIIFLVAEGLLLWRNFKTLSKRIFCIALCAVTAVTFITMTVETSHYAAVVKDNGGKVSFFQALSTYKGKPDEHKVYANEDGQDLTVSIYKTKPRTDGKLNPIYVFIHGGGWSSGDADGWSGFHRQMANEGFVAFSINYRLCSQGKLDNPTWDKAVYDCQKAMKWIAEHAEEYGGDINNMVLCGESAGGNLSLLYTGMVTKGALDGPKPKAVCEFFPAIDLEYIARNAKYLTAEPVPYVVEPYVGCELDEHPERWEAVSPFTWLNDKMPPLLIVHGEKDVLVDIQGSEKFVKQLNEIGGNAKLVALPYTHHGTGNQANKTIMLNYLKGIEGFAR